MSKVSERHYSKIEVLWFNMFFRVLQELVVEKGLHLKEDKDVALIEINMLMQELDMYNRTFIRAHFGIQRLKLISVSDTQLNVLVGLEGKKSNVTLELDLGEK
jgi:hypothetical protein